MDYKAKIFDSAVFAGNFPAAACKDSLPDFFASLSLNNNKQNFTLAEIAGFRQKMPI